MNEFSKFTIGEKHVFQKKITEADAAHNYGSKKLNDLFATPGLIAMIIDASVELVDPRLSEGIISIGYEIGVTHLKATKVGETVTVEITIQEIQEEKEIIFLKFNAYDEIGLIATGIHVRSIVNKESFFEKVDNRKKKLKIE